MPLTGLPRHPVSRWFLQRGLPRDPVAAPHLTAMLVAAVSTVLVVRGLLALSGYPKVGGGGLHIAHVLWGGLLMVVAFVLLLSFVGPAIRPVAAVVAGVGIGLFIDEVGKFVTSDNDYFYRPATAIMYVVVVGLVLLVHVLHGRRPHHPSEHLAGAVDQAVSGVVGGFTPSRRAAARAQLRRAGDVPGAAETAALLHAVPEDPVELFDPLRLARRQLVRLRREVTGTSRVGRALPAVIRVVLIVEVAQAAVTFGIVLILRLTGQPDLPTPTPLVVGLVSTVVAAATMVRGVLALRSDRYRGFVWFHRTVLVSLLVTRVFEFDAVQFLAVLWVLVDLLVLTVVGAELRRLDRASALAPVPAERALPAGQPATGPTAHPGQGPYPQPGQAAYPQPGQASQPGQPPYPQPGQARYPQSGQVPQPGQGPSPQPGQGPSPRPGQGLHPRPGQSPYPPPGQGTYPQPGTGPGADAGAGPAGWPPAVPDGQPTARPPGGGDWRGTRK